MMNFIRTKRHRKTDSGWVLQSEWTHASTVEFTDGTTLETKMATVTGQVSSHTHQASDIKGGTLSGQVNVPTDTNYSTNQLRNIVFLSEESDPGEGTVSSYANGSLICVYE